MQQINTEQKILEAAQKVFIEKGMNGARMQEIADEAGINKALLHYYFRSKQKLFEAIFTQLFRQISPNVFELTESQKPIKDKLGQFIENYLDVILKSPFLPAFVLNEVNRDIETFTPIFESIGFAPGRILAMLEREMKAGNLIEMDTRDLIINVLSMCLFPFAAGPLMQKLLFHNQSEQYSSFLEKRKRSVKEFVLNSVIPPDMAKQ